MSAPPMRDSSSPFPRFSPGALYLCSHVQVPHPKFAARTLAQHHDRNSRRLPTVRYRIAARELVQPHRYCRWLAPLLQWLLIGDHLMTEGRGRHPRMRKEKRLSMLPDRWFPPLRSSSASRSCCEDAYLHDAISANGASLKPAEQEFSEYLHFWPWSGVHASEEISSYVRRSTPRGNLNHARESWGPSLK
ncbi:hypothetical protein BDZ45DRAFT_23899 [Acephala macrosclerotiorum]|nr:hypothetical protein BDZ45DRAFT_23899 [Acephala macrosclerotiorum]